MIKPLKLFENKSSGTTYYKYFVPTVTPSTTGPVQELQIPTELILVNIIIKCSSTNFDFHFFNRKNTAINSPYNIFSQSGLNIEYNIETSAVVVTEHHSFLVFKNQDDLIQPLIYFQVKNNDAINATGIISLDIGVQQQ